MFNKKKIDVSIRNHIYVFCFSWNENLLVHWNDWRREGPMFHEKFENWFSFFFIRTMWGIRRICCFDYRNDEKFYAQFLKKLFDLFFLFLMRPYTFDWLLMILNRFIYFLLSNYDQLRVFFLFLKVIYWLRLVLIMLCYGFFFPFFSPKCYLHVVELCCFFFRLEYQICQI